MKAKMFFCEACGKPVALKASKCPHCGRLFDSVKCPKCSFSGKPDLFTDGCPSCGYLKRGGGGDDFVEIEPGLVRPDSEGLSLGTDQTAGSVYAQKRKTSRQLPGWAYTLLTAVLLVLLVVFIIVYIRL